MSSDLPDIPLDPRWPTSDDLQMQGLLMPCGLCQDLKPTEGMRLLPIDHESNWQPVCLDCQEECDL